MTGFVLKITTQGAAQIPGCFPLRHFHPCVPAPSPSQHPRFLSAKTWHEVPHSNEPVVHQKDNTHVVYGFIWVKPAIERREADVRTCTHDDALSDIPSLLLYYALFLRLLHAQIARLLHDSSPPALGFEKFDGRCFPRAIPCNVC